MGKALAVIGTILVAALAVVVVAYQAGRGSVSSLPASQAASRDRQPSTPPARVVGNVDTRAQAAPIETVETERETGSIPTGLPDVSEDRPTGASAAGSGTGGAAATSTPARERRTTVRTGKSRSADASKLRIWLTADQVRLTTPQLADSAFRTRLTRTLRGMEGVTDVRVGGSPIGKSLFVSFDIKQTSPPPLVERASELLADALSEDDAVELAFVGRDGRDVPVGCGCGPPPEARPKP